MTAQGELRGPRAAEARRGGGDWDAHADDHAAWLEPEPDLQCRAWLIGETSLLASEGAFRQGYPPVQCHNAAPVGSSICTPCHRRRIRARYRRLSLEHRQRIAAETGRPLEAIQ